MQSFTITLNAVAPAVLCLLLGKLLTRTALFRELSWASLEKVMFWVFLPPLIFSAIVRGNFAIGESLKLAAVFVIAQTTVAVVAVAHAHIARLPATTMTSLFQNAIR